MASLADGTLKSEDQAHQSDDEGQHKNRKDEGKGLASDSIASPEGSSPQTAYPSTTSKGYDHITFASTTPPNDSALHDELHQDNGSTYYSARSRTSFRSIFTRSTGKRSQNGATWLQALTKTLNSGFGGTRVVEGRERGGYLPTETGVGRTGKPPAPVPPSMLKALGVEWRNGEPQVNYEYVNHELEPPVHQVHQGFYGISLEDLHQRDGLAVPVIVTKCLQALNLYGLDQKRLYATHILESRAMKKLRDELQILTPATVHQLDLTKPVAFSDDIKAVAQVLYHYFELLPDPLLKQSFYGAFLKADEAKDPVAQRQSLLAIITNLPKAHSETLKALVEHFGRVIENSSANGIDSDELAGDWAHVILHRGMGLGTEPTPIKIRHRIVQAILDNRDTIFRTAN